MIVFYTEGIGNTQKIFLFKKKGLMKMRMKKLNRDISLYY